MLLLDRHGRADLLAHWEAIGTSIRGTAWWLCPGPVCSLHGSGYGREACRAALVTAACDPCRDTHKGLWVRSKMSSKHWLTSCQPQRMGDSYRCLSNACCNEEGHMFVTLEAPNSMLLALPGTQVLKLLLFSSHNLPLACCQLVQARSISNLQIQNHVCTRSSQVSQKS